MPFEIFLIPGLLFGLFGFYRGLRQKYELDEASRKKP
jgi:hypothetical protein